MKRRLALPTLATLLFLVPAVAGPEVYRAVAAIHNESVNASSDVFATDIKPTISSPADTDGDPARRWPHVEYEILVGIQDGAASSILNVQFKDNDGSNAQGLDLNDGTALDEGELYGFTVACVSTMAMNFQFETATTVGVLVVLEKRTP